MPTLPVDQKALTLLPPSRWLKPLARPQSQSMTALGARDSLSPPTVGAPSDSPVPGEEECTTIKPLGTQVMIRELEMMGLSPKRVTSGWTLGFPVSPNSCLTSQKTPSARPAVPA